MQIFDEKARLLAMWRPLDIFLYNCWPIRHHQKIFDKLSAIAINIHRFEKPQTHVTPSNISITCANSENCDNFEELPKIVLQKLQTFNKLDVTEVTSK